MSRAFFSTVYTVVDRVRMTAVILVFGFIITIGAVQIFMRYTPGLNPWSWVSEIMRYLNIWVVMLSASIGVKYGTHLKMDYLLYKIVPERAIRIILPLTRIMIVLALCLLIYYGVQRTSANLRTVIHSLPISIAWFYAAIPLGGALILMEYLLIFIHGTHPYHVEQKLEV
ncbi:MAG: TRAP transporter small permease [Spirochaetaceae bacterium]|nr:MAG: TRAP transporter small permease [Spirochaetaceae bacterium]